ncbi:MAG: 50S ribosomal protein L5 [Candidatus Aenigmatarchaeota archaeon]|nr:50S ribosomal protein L5 [Candidatus Aenigmarchaeota archaeon]
MEKENIMRKKIFLEKVVINIGCGGDMEKIERAKKLLEKMFPNRKFAITYSKKRSTFGVPKGKPIGVMLTLRGNEAIEFAKKVFKAYENKIPSSVFDDYGNFSLGIKKYIDLGVKYDHTIGLLGMDVCFSLRRPGYRLRDGTFSKKQRVTREEAIKFVKEFFNVEVV